MKRILLSFFLGFLSFSALALEKDLYSKHWGKRLNSIEIEGNDRTHDKVIVRELDIKLQKIIKAGEIQESLQRLWNLRIFSSVNFLFKNNDKEKVDLIVKVKERWTTLPIFKTGSGGGSKFITVGLYDINTFGKLLEFGGQYENLNGENSGVVWFRNPRLFDERLRLGIDLWFTKRNREIFNDSGTVLKAFTLDKKRINVFADKEFKNWLRFGVELTYDDEILTEDGLDEEQKRINRSINFDLGEKKKLLTYSFYGALGRLNFKNYLVEGFQSDFKISSTNDSLGSDISSTTARIQARYFKLFSHEQNVAINAVVGYTDTTLVQNRFFIGGLEEVRGFEDGQFNGNAFWQTNFEYRVPSIRRPSFVLQHVAFVDIGNANDNLDLLFSSDKQTFQSIGTGLRFISPKIFRLNIRVDFAKTFGRDERSDFSFGLQQFF